MDTLGLVETRSIAKGVEIADGMMKVAQVELVRAATVCSGRYAIFVAGDREAVQTAVLFAEESGDGLVGSYVISNVAPQVLEALKKITPAARGEAIAVIECRTVVAGVAASDSAVKRADVRLLRIVTGQGIHGKSYFVLGGDVAAVRAATEAAHTALGKQLIESVVIPRPDESVVRSLTHGVR